MSVLRDVLPFVFIAIILVAAGMTLRQIARTDPSLAAPYRALPAARRRHVWSQVLRGALPTAPTEHVAAVGLAKSLRGQWWPEVQAGAIVAAGLTQQDSGLDPVFEGLAIVVVVVVLVKVVLLRGARRVVATAG